MIFRIRPHGPIEFNVKADDPQQALDAYMKILNDHGFEIYQAMGGSGLAGKTFEEAETGPPKVIRLNTNGDILKP